MLLCLCRCNSQVLGWSMCLWSVLLAVFGGSLRFGHTSTRNDHVGELVNCKLHVYMAAGHDRHPVSPNASVIRICCYGVQQHKGLCSSSSN